MNLTKNPNLGKDLRAQFQDFVLVGGWEGERQGRALGGVGRGVEALVTTFM